MQDPSKINLTIFIHAGNQYTFHHRHWVEEITNELMMSDANNVDVMWNDLYEDIVRGDLLQIRVQPSATIHQLLVEVARFRKLHQAYPASVIQLLSGESLWDETKSDKNLDAIGITDGDLILMTYMHEDNSRWLLKPSPNATSLFESIRRDAECSFAFKELSSPLIGVLLYTDDDREIAEYVRSHFLDIYYMSGKLLKIYLIEKPPDRWRDAMEYWRGSLNEKLFRIWSLLGWLSTKPYERSQVYKVGERLGVLPDQFPCLVLFDNPDNQNKLIFPIKATTVDFRHLFSTIIQSFSTETDFDPTIVFESVRAKYASVLETLKQSNPVCSDSTKTQYVFCNHAVFVNCPQDITEHKNSILFLSADPTDASRLRLGEEFREINEQLGLANQRNLFKLELPQLSLRPKDISRALLNTQPQIVHFSGHGTSEGALCFEDDNGQIHLVQRDALAALFEQFANQVNCVILNACYSEAQAKAIAEHINYVIGMNKAIGDKAAIAFALGFYQALGGGRTIEDAYKLGCVQIRLQGIAEHLTPVLIKRGEIQP